ncbi:Citrate synthase 3, peroxisomal [Porphyridium purpureum]|uniref:Citrate synthase n=1 Tax=Porphyridium purpureum TaxID=35688 RepID=A0A5J4YXP5_PORPP|nr:Citrate synthase 3, peroxisomal [Porphyridium purpureum]|eukprot:POR7998..scf209_3
MDTRCAHGKDSDISARSQRGAWNWRLRQTRNIMDARAVVEVRAVDDAAQHSAGQEQQRLVVSVQGPRSGAAKNESVVLDITNGAVPAGAFKKVGPGVTLHDPGYTNTASCTSAITFIDGDKGLLRYRGYPVQELVAANKTTLEVAWLLFYGELPEQAKLNMFAERVAQNAFLRSTVLNVVQAMPTDAHPMGVLASALAAWGTQMPEFNPALSGNAIYDDTRLRQHLQPLVLGGFTSLAAAIFLRMQGLPGNVIALKCDLRSTAPGRIGTMGGMFLDMIGKGNLPASVAHALDILLVLHADHELNCSTATMRQLTSSGVDLFSSLAGSVCALYGPLHGGATEAVLRMLQRIETPDNVASFIDKVKNRDEKLMGFGHRIYRNYDPRATLIRKLAHKVLKELDIQEPLLQVAMALEKTALEDDYFVSRKLYPNVDFYSGIIYSAIGFPPEFFPVLFALGRVAGWLSHWNEFVADEWKERKIARPQQLYVGEPERHLLPSKLYKITMDTVRILVVRELQEEKRSITDQTPTHTSTHANGLTTGGR